MSRKLNWKLKRTGLEMNAKQGVSRKILKTWNYL